MTLNLEDLERIVGGATPPTSMQQQQYDAAKQAILGTISNADIANAVAADAASIAASPANITAAITNIESQAAADHVSQAAALAALDAATYGNAKIGGTDAVAAELTKVLSNGSAETDMAHLAALGTNAATLVPELNQAVNVLAIGSADGHTALGLQTNAAVAWVEAKLESAAGAEAAADNSAAASANASANQMIYNAWVHPGSVNAQTQSEITEAQTQTQTYTTEAQSAASLQTLLDTSHQSEVTEGKEIDAVITALGSHAAAIEKMGEDLSGMSGTAALIVGQTDAVMVEHMAGVQKDVALLALDLFSQGNSVVQQMMSTELNSQAIETNLAQAVATGGLTADQAVQALNLTVADLSQNSVDPATVPQLEQNFATANADVALANAAAALAQTDASEAASAASSNYGAVPNMPLANSDTQQSQLAASLQTLINTNYSGQVALANELAGITADLGPNATNIIQDAENLISNPGMAATYISDIEASAQAAESSATFGSTHGAFSVDEALTLLAAYSHGNSTVLNEIETRLVNGTAEADLANLVAVGAISSTQAATTLAGMADALTGNSPTNSVTLTDSAGHTITLDRNSTLDWAEAQLTKAGIAVQQQLAANVANDLTGGFFRLGDGSQSLPLLTAIAELANEGSLVSLLETTHGSEVIQGLGIEIGWASVNAAADSAAAIAAGTETVQGMYGPTQEVSASAQALADSINAKAAALTNADFALAQQIIELNLTNAANGAQGGTDQAKQAAVESAGEAMTQVFGAGLSIGEAVSPDIGDTANVIKDPTSLANWESLGADIGTTIAMDAAGVGLVEKLGVADKGMVWLLDQSVVSSVLGSELTGDLKGYYQTAADACEGITNCFKDSIHNSINLVVDGGGAIVTDLANNLSNAASDFASGNITALGHDFQNLVSNFGSDLVGYAKDWGNMAENDAKDIYNDVTTMFGNMASDIMSSPTMSAAVHWVDDQGQALVNDLSEIGVGAKDIENWFAGAGGEALKVVESLGNDIAGVADSFVSGLEDLGGDIGDAFKSGWDTFCSWF